MKFIEITGRSLAAIISDDEIHANDLSSLGVTDETVVRINEHGDIEVRRPHGWDVVGGLLGDYGERIKHETGMDWA